MTKQQLEKEIKSLKSHKRIFTILAFSFLAVGTGLAITSLVLSVNTKDSELYLYFAYFASMAFSVSLTFFIIGMAVFNFRINNRIIQYYNGEPQVNNSVKVDRGTTEVKVKTKEEMLLDQYEELLKNGYITQEDFDKKKEELSPKKNG